MLSMRRPVLTGAVVFFAVLLFFIGVLPAQDRKAESEPTIITSKSLSADNKAKTALFEGSVVARKGDMIFSGDRMLVYYSDEKGSSAITKIEAEGNVKLVKGERVITARSATYFATPEEKAIFTGDPRASEGENVITGTRMTYFMKDERSLVENSKVFLVDKQPKAGTGSMR
jgi:lipopolysaccharide export system protein LptA